MESANLKEYEGIRKDISDVKACTTQYLGFVLGGSGLAMFGFGLLSRESVSALTLVYAPMALSIVLTLVLFILYYKFNSHNRYAAYCFVLSVERWTKNDRNLTVLVAWEPCIGRLVDIDSHPNDAKTYFNRLPREQQIPEIRRAVDEYVGTRRKGTNAQWRLGWQMLRSFLLGRHMVSRRDGGRGGVMPGTWLYPLWVTMPFVVLSSLFALVPFYVGIGILIEYWDAIHRFKSFPLPNGTWVFRHEMVAVALAGAGTVFFHFRVWRYLLHKLHQLVEGDACIPAYVRRFQLIRSELLLEYGITSIHQ